MSFRIDSAINNGYPHIPDMPDIPSVMQTEPYHRYFLVTDENRNNGYPIFKVSEDIPDTVMRKIYPHGIMLCMGNDVNDGYPCIPEINGVKIKQSSSLYFGGKLISDMYYGKKQIFSAYCNEKEVFSVKYIHS